MNNFTYPAYTDNADIKPINENFRVLAAAAVDAEDHAANTNNPHGVNKNDVGLGNVLNVEQASKADLLKHINQTGLHNKIMIGTFTGDGTAERFINLNATPSAVLVADEKGAMVHWQSGGIRTHYGGIALTGVPVLNSKSNKVLEIAENGFNVFYMNDSNNEIHVNSNSTSRIFIAFFGCQFTEVE